MKKIALLGVFLGLLVGCGEKPQSVEQLRKAGERAYARGEYAEARRYLSQAVAQKPSDPKLLYLLGVSYQRDFLYDSAYLYLKRADILFPGDRDVNLAIYQVARALKEWRSAIKAIHALIKSGDPQDKYLRELAELNINMENYEVAYYFYRRLLEKEPDSLNHFLIVANLALQLDSVDIALNVIDSAIERFGERDELLVNKGMYLAAHREYPKAEAIFRSLLAKDTTEPALKLNLANVLASQDDTAKKKEAYQLYLELKESAGPELRLDSLIEALEAELNQKK
jgi:tetratricopeptide (TPR) repeat protein